ncbi:hypothetical protein GMSM_17280 [Geomonas sp. Red276]
MLNLFYHVVSLALCVGTGILVASPYAYLVPVIWSAIALSFVLLKRPVDNYILLAVFLYPLLPFHFGFDPGKPLPIIKLHRLLLFSVYFVWFAKRGSAAILESLKSYPLYRVTWITVCVLALACLLNRATFQAYNYLLSFVAENCLFSFFVFDYFKSGESQSRLLKTICFSGLTVALLGMVERVIGFNWYSLVPSYREEVDYALEEYTRFDMARVKGAFTHAISFGATTALIMAICVFFLYQATTRAEKLKWITIITLLFLACYLSISRGPLAMFLFILMLMAAYRAKRWASLCLVVAALVIAQPFVEIEALAKVKTMIDSSFNSSGGEMSESSSIRLTQFASAWKFIVARPLTGHGFRPFNNDLDKTIDNFYLRYVLNFGFMGMSAYLLYIVTIFKKSYFVFKNTDTYFNKLFSLTVMASFLGLLLLWCTVSLEEYMFYISIMTGISMVLYSKLQVSETGEGGCP